MLDLSQLPHHDGSPLYLSRVSAGIQIRLSAPPGAYLRVSLRWSASGEVHADECVRVADPLAEFEWWSAVVPDDRGSLHYRFLLVSLDQHLFHYNPLGVSEVEPLDDTDFRYVVHDAHNDVPSKAVAYFILLDRFARSSTSSNRNASNWSADPRRLASPMRFYGGDLAGVSNHLNELQELGVDVLVISPFFPAPEFHRYCAESFDEVDEELGGEAALVGLVGECHERGMLCLGDLTLNHCGSTHPWFARAISDPTSLERIMFSFHTDGTYHCYYGVETLPSLNYSAQLTIDRMISSENAPLKKWVRAPFLLDGWRFDAAPLVGRCGEVDLNRVIATVAIDELTRAHANALHFAEILHDPANDLRDGRWAGTTRDAGFASPVRDFVENDHFGGEQLWRKLSLFAEVLDWATLTRSLNFVGSHDIPRIASIAGSPGRSLMAHFLLLTMPGTPMLYAGDEYYLLGATTEEARQPIHWTSLSSQARWFFDQLRQTIFIRRENPALQRGSLRWLAAGQNAVAYERRDLNQRLVCVAGRRRDTLAFQVPSSYRAPMCLYAHDAQWIQDGSQARIALGEGGGFGVWRLDHDGPHSAERADASLS